MPDLLVKVEQGRTRKESGCGLGRPLRVLQKLEACSPDTKDRGMTKVAISIGADSQCANPLLFLSLH